jgi:hypothetical protein
LNNYNYYFIKNKINNKNINILMMKNCVIIDCKNENILFSCPVNLNYNTISEIKSIFETFKENNFNRYKISTSDGYYLFHIYSNKLFTIVNVTNSYSETIAEEFVNSINEEINKNEPMDIEFINNSIRNIILTRKTREIIFKNFEKYKTLDSQGSVNKKIKIEDIDVSDHFNTNTFTELDSNRNFSNNNDTFIVQY